MFTKEEKNRYSRQIILPEIGIEGQEKLKAAKVLVVGAGGLGCPVLQYLAAAGVGTIGIADGDVVDETNLQRQILFSQEDIGKPKAEIAAKKLSQLNPFCLPIAIGMQIANCQLTSKNALGLIKEYDVIIDGSDNFPTRYLVNDACVMLNKPLVFGSIFKFEGQVSVFNYKGGPTYRCLFPEPPEDSPNCSETGVTAMLPGIIGTLMANEALKIILGIGNVLSGKLLVFDSLEARTEIISFNRNPENSKVTLLDDYESFCQSGAKDKPELHEITSTELKKMLESRQAIQIIDVREPYEYEEQNLGGLNIPLHDLVENAEKIRKDIPVIVHCQNEGRSKMAIEILEKKFGFTNLYRLKGGIESFTPSEYSAQ